MIVAAQTLEIYEGSVKSLPNLPAAKQTSSFMTSRKVCVGEIVNGYTVVSATRTGTATYGQGVRFVLDRPRICKLWEHTTHSGGSPRTVAKVVENELTASWIVTGQAKLVRDELTIPPNSAAIVPCYDISRLIAGRHVFILPISEGCDRHYRVDSLHNIDVPGELPYVIAGEVAGIRAQ